MCSCLKGKWNCIPKNFNYMKSHKKISLLLGVDCTLLLWLPNVDLSSALLVPVPLLGSTGFEFKLIEWSKLFY